MASTFPLKRRPRSTEPTVHDGLKYALGVLEFTALPWATLFGWLFFDEAVRPQVWLGALVIFAACWWVGRAERKPPVILPTPQ